jgi:subtilisin family serine protease
VAAIDQAVADGVDVINLSISGSRTSLLNPVAVAFRHAAAAGVFAANSAGNSGDTIGESSVAHNSPWVTTVAASTHDRGFVKRVTLGDGRTFAGIGMSPAVPTSPLLNSTLAGLAGADPTQVQLCFPGTLDPAKVTGKIIACDRGVIARVDKSRAVQLAGGVGMILMNVTPSSLNADFHFVPTVHVDHIVGAEIRAYSLTAGATAALSATDSSPVRAPQMASFSSFGPALAGGGDLLKPDITAPGVDVLAAAAPPGVVGLGNVWGQISGTSMSSPHIAGIAALLMQYHPTWSPMAVKSALMTTAKQTDNTGAPIQRGDHAATPLDYGAGHVAPASGFDPGLVYDSGELDWLRYMCGIGQNPVGSDGQDLCPSVGTIDPSNLNYPSIAIGDIGDSQTVIRKVTNVSSSLAKYRPVVEAPAGYLVKVVPSSLTVAAGQVATFAVTFVRTTAVPGEWSFGSLTWTDGAGHRVRSPIALRQATTGTAA